MNYDAQNGCKLFLFLNKKHENYLHMKQNSVFALHRKLKIEKQTQKRDIMVSDEIP